MYKHRITNDNKLSNKLLLISTKENTKLTFHDKDKIFQPWRVDIQRQATSKSQKFRLIFFLNTVVT